MKRILVPCDFSKQSNEAFKMAIEMALKSKSEITNLHVLAIPTMYTTGVGGEPLTFDPAYYTSIEEDAKKELEQMKDKATSKSIKITAEVVYDELVSAVKRLIETKQIDLVIMGMSGATGFSEIFIGSNTEKTVRFSPVRVLAVRNSFELRSIKNILLPSSLDLNQTAFMKKVIDFAYTAKMDLIAMVTHARKGLAHFFTGSIAENDVNQIQLPIWTFCLKH